MYRFLAYAMPFILVAIETCLRTALNTDTSGFVGPTLATAAVGVLLPSLAPKSKSSALSQELQAELQKLKVSVRSKADERMIVIALLFLFLFIAAWVWALVLAERKVAHLFLGFDAPIWIGFICYFAGIIIAEIKEAA